MNYIHYDLKKSHVEYQFMQSKRKHKNVIKEVPSAAKYHLPPKVADLTKRISSVI